MRTERRDISQVEHTTYINLQPYYKDISLNGSRCPKSSPFLNDLTTTDTLYRIRITTRVTSLVARWTRNICSSARPLWTGCRARRTHQRDRRWGATSAPWILFCTVFWQQDVAVTVVEIQLLSSAVCLVREFRNTCR